MNNFENWDFIIGDPMAISGFDIETLERIFQKYCGRNTVVKTRKYLFDIMFFLKTYPSVRHDASRTGRKSYGALCDKVRKGIFDLSGRVNELNDAFDRNHKLILDAFPIYIQRPKSAGSVTEFGMV
jgi:hypothetical protein